MKQLTAKFTVTFDRILEILALLAALILVFIMFSVSAGVIMRYFVRQPLQWVLEVSEYGLVYITFLTAAWVLRKEGHVRIDLVLGWLRPKAQALVNTITSILCIFICLTLVWYGTRLTWEYFQAGRYEDTPLRTPLALVLVIIPLGAFLLFIQFLRRTRGYWASWRAPTKKQQGRLEG